MRHDKDSPRCTKRLAPLVSTTSVASLYTALHLLHFPLEILDPVALFSGALDGYETLNLRSMCTLEILVQPIALRYELLLPLPESIFLDFDLLCEALP